MSANANSWNTGWSCSSPREALPSRIRKSLGPGPQAHGTESVFQEGHSHKNKRLSRRSGQTAGFSATDFGWRRSDSLAQQRAYHILPGVARAACTLMTPPKCAEPPDAQLRLQLLKQDDELMETTGASRPTHQDSEVSWVELPDELLLAITRRANAQLRARLVCKAFAVSLSRSMTRLTLRATPGTLPPIPTLHQPLLAALGLPFHEEHLGQLAAFKGLTELDLSALPSCASPLSLHQSGNEASDSTLAADVLLSGPQAATASSPQPTAANTANFLASLPVPPKLCRLALPNIRLSPAAAEQLKMLPAVSFLSFTAPKGAPMTEDMLAALQSLPLCSLQVLVTSAESSLQLLKQIASISSLESLTLPAGLPLDAAKLPPQEWMNRLTSLTLGQSDNTKWEQQQEVIQALVPYLSGLKKLDLDVGKLCITESICNFLQGLNVRLTLRSRSPHIASIGSCTFPNLVALHATAPYTVSTSACFTKFQALKTLDIGCRLQCQDLESIQQISCLQQLTLRAGFDFRQPERASILAKLTTLKRLSIQLSRYNYRFDQQLPRVLDAVAQLRQLADLHLILDSPSLKLLDAQQLLKIAAELHIQIGLNSSWQSAPLHDLSFLEGLSQLRTLRILWSVGLARDAWDGISRLSGVRDLAIFAPLPEWAMWHLYMLCSLQRLTLSNAHGDVPEHCLRELAFLLQSDLVQWHITFECPIWHMSHLFTT